MVTLTSTQVTSSRLIPSAKNDLQQIVEALSKTPDIALARIWLIQSTESCEICTQRNSPNPPQERSLHLVASSGRSQNSSQPEVWNRLDGAFHCFPLDSEKIGHIGATGKPSLVHHAPGETSLLNRDWLTREGIQSFFGCPLAYEGQIFGVFAVFSRLKLTERDLCFLQQIADGSVRVLTACNKFSEKCHQLQCVQSINRRLQHELESASGYGPLVACGPASRKLDQQINLAATHCSPILITGERGAGKELAARLIHQRQGGFQGSFVTIHGASLTPEFLTSITAVSESSLRDSESAGTLFIDAVEDTPIEVQDLLVKSIYSSTRSKHPPTIDDQLPHIRVIASSKSDLCSEIAPERFRHDLYCALSIVSIEVPPLRQRIEDLPELTEQILADLCHREHRERLELDSAALDRLARYDWPGNVRELQYVLGCAVTQSRGGLVVFDEFLKSPAETLSGEHDPAFLRADAMKRQERANILVCLQQCDWKVYGPGGAAEKLGVKPTTLMYRLKVLGIRKPTR